MWQGHDPRDIDEYALRDLHLFWAALPVVQGLINPFVEDP